VDALMQARGQRVFRGHDVEPLEPIHPGQRASKSKSAVQRPSRSAA
jgi:hypothetical protein